MYTISYIVYPQISSQLSYVSIETSLIFSCIVKIVIVM
nr:MAG TPA: hypothetical protein [Caudoviricetes sp.]